MPLSSFALNRREFLWFAGSVGGVLAGASAAETGDFDPLAWLRARNLGKLNLSQLTP